jgi:ABC-2 type transport system permease protein
MTGSKSPIFAVIGREIDRIRQNPAYRFLLFMGPMVGILLLYFIFRQGAVKELPVAIVDQDHSTLSIKIANYIDAASDVEVVMHANDLFQAQKLLENGVVDAVVLVPIDTERSIYEGVESVIPVYINGTNILKAGLLQRSLLTSLKTISGGIQLKKLMASGKNEQQAMARIVPVNIEKHVLFNPYTNYTYFLNSAMLYVMLYLFVLLSSIYTLGNELKRGTGKELLDLSNQSVRMAIVGKMFPYSIIFSGIAMFVNFLLYYVEGMPLAGSFLIIFVGQFITIITYQLMGLIFVGATSNLRLALSLGSAYSMLGITFSGLTFPMEGMPICAQYVTAVFPFTWWEKLVISQSLRGAPITNALPYICYILIFMVVSLCFLIPYKHFLSDPKYWGKE